VQLTSTFFVGRGFFITLQVVIVVLVAAGWFLVHGLRPVKAFSL
jgi:hypothetical protein